MQANYMTPEMHERLWSLLSNDENRQRTNPDASEDSSRISGPGDAKDAGDSSRRQMNLPCERPSLSELVVMTPPGFALPKQKTITISVITGPSKGLMRRLVKPHISIGRSGGGADIEVDDQGVSDLHCAVGVKDSIIRLCDLDSQSGTYIENQRVSVAPLEHLSEFRVGSTVLLVTVLPARGVSPEDPADDVMNGKEE